MSIFTREPPRNASLDSLTPMMREKVNALLKAMWRLGYDAQCFECQRSQARQDWLYSIGRTRQKNRKPVTWTRHSNHLSGEAADIISKRKGWAWPEFYVMLKKKAAELGLHTIPQEGCHVQLWKP